MVAFRSNRSLVNATCWAFSVKGAPTTDRHAGWTPSPKIEKNKQRCVRHPQNLRCITGVRKSLASSAVVSLLDVWPPCWGWGWDGDGDGVGMGWRAGRAGGLQQCCSCINTSRTSVWQGRKLARGRKSRLDVTHTHTQRWMVVFGQQRHHTGGIAKKSWIWILDFTFGSQSGNDFARGAAEAAEWFFFWFPFKLRKALFRKCRT